MTASFSSRAFLLAVATALPGAMALAGLPMSGSPGMTAVPAVAAPPAATPAATPLPAAPLPAAARPHQARPLPADLPSTAPRPTDLRAPLPAKAVQDLLDRQAAAGLDCAVSASQVPVCVHGDDSEPLPEPAAAVYGTSTGSTGSDGTIGCYGDGTSDRRVRAVYARPQSAEDRYAASLSSIRGWAAGVSRQVDTSATRTKGRRHVRFATTPGASCSLVVLNVVLPDSAFDSFTATVDALQARGLDVPLSKYLVWADAQGYCGVATTYADDSPGLDNLNNGAFPSYARVDRRCWGKVETHELVHMLGGVQRSAPNATAGGHCNDGRDPMCYADGTSGSTQRKVCADADAAVLDCRNDDYFSTAAPRGSYLQTHWNAARNSFLAATLSDPAPAPAPSPSASATPKPAATPSPSPSPSPSGPRLPLLDVPLPTLAPAPLLLAAVAR